MVNNFKSAYCFYVVKLLLQCKSDLELEKVLDRIIDRNKFNQFITGDEDVKRIFEYVYNCRCYTRHLISNEPAIETGTVVKVIKKSIF